MSAASRPHRRLFVTLPSDEAAIPAPSGSTTGRREAGAPAAASGAASPRPADAHAAAKTPDPKRRRLHLTMPSGVEEALRPDSAEEPAGGVPQAPPDVGPGLGPAAGASAARPRRRLSLTLPTGVGPDGPREPAGLSRAGKVEVGCQLPRDVADRLEEEWWRRQAEGESCSRSQIIQAALEIALADPERLSRALARDSRTHPK